MSDHHVVTAVLVDGDRLLLCHRSPGRRWYPNVWDLPGGHVEAGESELSALRREVREELGVEILAVDEAPCARILDGAEDVPEGRLRQGLWVVRAWRGEPANLAPEEHDELRWVSSADLDGLTLAHGKYPSILRAALTQPASSPAPSPFFS